ncbi:MULTISPECIES: DNA glycosylase AlkZ-like family protein [unclassified Rhizobacter]|uniref:DNA glycosylase AlkZ-like family protein n=1 Tax=unclassified Rhizobacter TaxID=2640088 RepID=UPI0006FAB76F|nr:MULTISPECIES: crosslink repair DNA glycosylase YcaQ family protein [unclassified Rhizobacter]KQU67861.1 cytoplasmic protein [Rhizobacter sp. Root29]KQW15252.1 cytoplasmic protein [Rhizobacter sp. Root1238]KRB24416.1 cytoplasmic protein [Rhizobacter sp. Root16D2]
MPITLDHLRRYAVARTLFKPTTLLRAIRRLGFVQADPIRSPARAQDLTLRHRVKDYRAGDLERRYATLPVEEDCLVNYGFLPREHLALMHPRIAKTEWDRATRRRAADVLAFVRERGRVHPREVDEHFAHGSVTNYWGGSSSATTHLLDGMHYRGMLRVVRRDAGIRVYEAVEHAPADESPAERARRAAELLALIVRKYAPLPARSLTHLTALLNYGAPHLKTQTQAAMKLAREQLASLQLDGVTWYWPADENPASRRHAPDDAVRLLAPFDPVVWDRIRFELLWDWAYRFEAYTPAPKRRFGYYALPLLWHDRVIGWGNLSMVGGQLKQQFGYVDGRAPRDAAFKAGLADEIARMRSFLGADSTGR